jgi:hypothetical protein
MNSFQIWINQMTFRFSLLHRNLVSFFIIFPVGTGLFAAETPATLQEIKASIDWTKVPLLPGAENVRHRFSTSTLKAPGTFLDAAGFYRKALPTIGWIEDETPIPGVDQKDYLALFFDKGDMRLQVSGYRTEPTGPMTITLSLSGNVDAKTFPKPADAKVRTESRTFQFYTTAAKPEDAADFCRKAIVAKGWNEVKADSADFFAKEGRIVLRFLKNAMEIGVVAAKTKDETTEVSLSTSIRNTFEPKDVKAALTAKEIPTPPTVTDYVAVLDLRKFTKMASAKPRDRQRGPMVSSSTQFYQVESTLKDVILFHEKAFKAEGWVEKSRDADLEDRVEIHFEKQGYLVTLGASQQKGAKNLELGITNFGNVDLRQLPFPEGAEIGAERSSFINTKSRLDDSATRAFYQKELEALGWKLSKSTKGRGAIEFIQNASVIRIEIGKDPSGQSTIRLRTSLLGVE